MTNKISCFLLFITCTVLAQQKDSIVPFKHFATAEFLLGKTQDANSGFPDTKLQKSFTISIGNHQDDNYQEWAYRLRYPKTGLAFTITDYGNKEYIGYSATLMPFLEYGVLKKLLNNRFNMNVGVGASYFTQEYKGVTFSNNNIIENNNRAISTRFTWAFKAFFYYDVYKEKNANWRLGTGYFHQSNGHTKLPNQGLNSFLFSVSRQSNHNFKYRDKPVENELPKDNYKKSIQSYFTIRSGFGVNVLSEVFNDKKGVYTIAASYGKILNKTFKIGLGFYYRYYDSFNTYIENGEELIVEEYPHFQENSFKYSTSYGVFVSSEIYLGHIGIEADLGYNIYKPFYEVEWKLNQGFYWDATYEDGTTETVYILGELNSKYELKRAILARLGLKYYLFNNNDSPKSNVFIAATINANLGQADFTELSIGYVHRFQFKEKK